MEKEKIKLLIIRANSHSADFFYKIRNISRYVQRLEYDVLMGYARINNDCDELKQYEKEVRFIIDIPYLISDYFNGRKNRYIEALLRKFFYEKMKSNLEQMLKKDNITMDLDNKIIFSRTMNNQLNDIILS